MLFSERKIKVRMVKMMRLTVYPIHRNLELLFISLQSEGLIQLMI